MKAVLGVLCVIAGVALGLYVGVWVLWIGGVIDVVHGVTADPADAGLIAWGLAKALILAQLVGSVIFVGLSAIGVACFEWEPRR